MAEQQTATFPDKPVSAKQKEKDFEEHVRTYKAVMQGTKWSIIVLVAILVGLYFVFVH